MSFVTEETEVIIETNEQLGTSKALTPRVAAVFTGGTIAVSANKTAPKPVLTGREIMERVPEVAQYLPSLKVQVHDFAMLPGPHMSPEMMLTLAGFLNAIGENMDGVVITHGTDSMEECAYFLDLVSNSDGPIVFTGSMHPSTDAAWDGGRNLVDALAVASNPEFRGIGSVIVMNGLVHAASEVTKTHTMRPDTFQSPDFGPLGTVSTLAMDEPRRLRDTKHRVHIPLTDDAELPYVELFVTYSGMDDSLFVAALKSGAQGIVIEAMGQGNVPPGVVNGIARAREMKIPVVITSRCHAGPVRPYYAYEGAGRELERLGYSFFRHMATGPKARIKLMVALAAGKRGEELQALFPQ